MKSIGKIVIVAIFAVISRASAQELDRTSMGITGCSPSYSGSLAATSDGRIAFAGCEGPRGLFYSRDAGVNWSYAGVPGTAYTEGSGTRLYVTDTHAWQGKNTGGGLLSTPLPQADEAWSPSWADVQFAEYGQFHLVSKVGRFLIGESGPGSSRKIYVFDTQSRTVVSTKDLPARSDKREINVVPGGDGSFIFAATGTKDFFSAQGQTMELYRIPFNNGVVGEWEAPVPLVIDGVPEPGRYTPTPIDPDDGKSFRIENIVISPHNKIYVSFPLIPDNGATKGCNQPIYVSTDLGVTFVEEVFSGVTPSGGAAHACTPMRGVSFQDSTYLIEGLLSVDAGATWSALWSLEQQDPVLADWKVNKSISLDPSVVFVAPQNWLLLRHKNGYVRAFNPNGGDWSDRTWAITSGFLAIDLKSIAKSYSNPNSTVISSIAGWSISNNFLSERPTWQENYCPNADCYGGTGVAADPRADKSNVFYMGGNPWIYRVTLGSGGLPSAEKYINKAKWFDQADQAGYGQIYTNPSALPNTLVVTLGKDLGNTPIGGVFFHDLTRESCTENGACPPTKIAQIEHSDGIKTTTLGFTRFIAVNQDVMFAVAGGPYHYAQAYAHRALYQSKDGGTTFQKVNDPLMNGAGKVISSFEYDSHSDTLYATWIVNNTSEAPNSTGIVRLPNASTGSGAWQALTNPADPASTALTAIAYDHTTGTLMVGGQRNFGPNDGTRAMVWSSSDGGLSWSESTRGLKDEKVNFLSFDNSVTGADFHAASVSSRRIQGSSTGLYALKAAATPTPSPTPTPGPNPTPNPTPISTPIPTPNDTSCSLKVSPNCRGTIRKGTSCEFTAVIKSKRPISKTKANLEYSSSPAGAYSKYSSKAKLVQKKKIFSMRVKAKGYIRAVFDDPSCETKPVQIKMNKR